MSNIKVLNQYIKDLSFEVPLAPDVFLQNSQKPDINLSIDIDAKKIQEDTYEVTLKITANADATDKKIFICEIAYCGLFSIINLEEEEEVEQILLIYCPNILFPFVRRIITNIAIDAGFPPLMIEPINFGELYNRRLELLKNGENNS
jgi:preprotein translocase subunit SecB